MSIWMEESKAAYLLLSDGTLFTGRHFGAEGTYIGEAMFTTAMVGYQEALTDPSNYGSVIVQTFPLAGNYGVNAAQMESSRAWAGAFVVREWCDAPSSFRCEGDLDTFLKEQNVVGLYDIDTRHLTRHLRDHGSMPAMVTTQDVFATKDTLLQQLAAWKVGDALRAVSCREMKCMPASDAKKVVAVYDYGCTNSLINRLHALDCDVVLLPWDTKAADLAALSVKGVILPHGAGDPESYGEAVKILKGLDAVGVPVFGYGLGHQLYALAHGAHCEKLKYGHHGGSQPVLDLRTNRTYVTTQNHSYTVTGISPDVAEVCFKNANDGTCEGLLYKNVSSLTVEFTPGAYGETLLEDFVRGL